MSGGLGGVGRAGPVQEHQRAVAHEGHAERSTRLAVAGCGVDPLLVECPVDQATQPRAVLGEGALDDVDSFAPREFGRQHRCRCHQVPPSQPTVRTVAVQGGLRAHPAAEVGECVGHGRLHRLEGCGGDAVGEQRGVQRRAPVAPPVHAVRFAFDGVHRGGHRQCDRRPGLHLGVVSSLADLRVVGGRQPAHRRHRQAPGAVREVDDGSELGGDVALQAAPRGRTVGGQFGVEVLLGRSHLVVDTLCQAVERAAVLPRLVTHLAEGLDTECPGPLGEAPDEWAQPGRGDPDLTEQGLGLLMTRVGGDRRIHVSVEVAEFPRHPVVSVDRVVGGLPVGGGRGARLGGADAELVEAGDQAVDLGAETLQRVGERPGIERLVHVGDAPAREGVVAGRGQVVGGHGRSREVQVGKTPAYAARVMAIRKPSDS